MKHRCSCVKDPHETVVTPARSRKIVSWNWTNEKKEKKRKKRRGRLGNVKSARGKARYVFNSRACLSPEINRFSRTNSATPNTYLTKIKTFYRIVSRKNGNSLFPLFFFQEARSCIRIWLRYFFLPYVTFLPSPQFPPPVYFVIGTNFQLIFQLFALPLSLPCIRFSVNFSCSRWTGREFCVVLHSCVIKSVLFRVVVNLLFVSYIIRGWSIIRDKNVSTGNRFEREIVLRISIILGNNNRETGRLENGELNSIEIFNIVFRNWWRARIRFSIVSRARDFINDIDIT